MFAGPIFGCANQTPTDSAGAVSKYWINAPIQIQPIPSSDPRISDEVRFDFFNVRKTRIVPASQQCQGAAGSAIPPIAIDQCGGAIISSPLDFLTNVTEALSGQKASQSHVRLAGIERYWVPQSRNPDCWAAAFATAEMYTRARSTTRQQVLEYGNGICPDIQSQLGGASTYQIYYIYNSLHGQIYGQRGGSSFCDDLACIIIALLNRHPVIALSSGHAVIIAGADYLADPALTGGKFFPVAKKFYILDPAADPDAAGYGHLEARSVLEMCRAEAFLVY
jgi:hypothetical protein